VEASEQELQTSLIGVAGNGDSKAVTVFFQLHLEYSNSWRRQRLKTSKITWLTIQYNTNLTVLWI